MRCFRPPFAYPRAQMQAQVLERLEAGATRTGLGKVPGFPSRMTLFRWAEEDPDFARRLSAAWAWGRGVRKGARNASELFDAARAQAFLLRVRQGEAVRSLVVTPGQPTREVLNLWKRMRPDFAAELDEAVCFARDTGDRRRPFDPATADAMVRRVSRGETIRGLWKDPAMPGEKVLRRWQRQRPDFAAALKAAWQIAHRRRRASRPRCTPELTEAIAAHVVRGGSLHSASRAPGMPCYATLYAWKRAKPDFALAIAAAQEERHDRLLDQAMTLAERLTPQTLEADAHRLGAIRRRVGQLSGGRRGS
jgi:hypothetical protein